MKKFIALSAIVTLIIAAANFVSCNNNSDKQAKDGTADSIQKVLDHGKYLATNVAMCIHCHSQRDFTKYAGPVTNGTEGKGGQLFDQNFGLPGKIYSKNITPDNETGIGTWTDDELLRAITQGISKNGDTLFPLMPYTNYNRMAKEDLLSIIAYIRTLKPIKNKVAERQLMMPIALAYPGQYLQASVDGNTKPSTGDMVKYGEYLITIADCGTCHSPLTPQGPDLSRMYAGGYTFNMGSNKVQSANITSDTATGIGSWTEERFLNKFHPYLKEESYNFDPGNQNTVMPVIEIAGMKDADLKAIYAYLRTVKPNKNLVEKFPK
ncbi:MAG: cytochrome C [Chitinophagaceae bacterium]|nr:cytochrome C [Chitinophagaceae bacterium]MBK8309510.1 cytochrome C [Chitinophagaceae bacterium]MBK8606327.1 cytochrome C [Chitinophagaceae bacterium]MBP6477107.1 cytochrome C [Chitinophagaceae bacterium]MBP7109144.1 cytochrome C [Chitinophagaceae bacterium]